MLPKVPAAWILSIGLFGSLEDRDLGFTSGGLPIIVILSYEGSSSDSASRSHDDCKRQTRLPKSKYLIITFKMIFRTLKTMSEAFYEEKKHIHGASLLNSSSICGSGSNVVISQVAVGPLASSAL